MNIKSVLYNRFPKLFEWKMYAMTDYMEMKHIYTKEVRGMA